MYIRSKKIVCVKNSFQEKKNISGTNEKTYINACVHASTYISTNNAYIRIHDISYSIEDVCDRTMGKH